MKKRLFFLITLITTLLCGKAVMAETNFFWEAEHIYDIYMSKYQYSTGTTYYQQARVFRDQNDRYTYCIEPFVFFNEGSVYQDTTTPRNLSKEQIDRIQKIVYFGFGYTNHSEASWYAVTQMMIWKTAASNDGDYFFTSTLNGARTNAYDWQMDEINRLINEYDKNLSINNKTYTLVKGTSKEIEVGDELKNYSTNNKEIEIKNNKIIIKDLEEGEYTITLKRNTLKFFYRPIVIFESFNSQNMIRTGDLDPKEVTFKIKVIKNHINILKVDEDTKEATPQGKGKLDGAIYELRDENNNVFTSVEIKNSTARIENIPFGKYYLVETKAGEGYKKNDKIYEIIISEENPNVEIQVTNKIIEKKIIIKKLFGEKDDMKPEANIDFEIYDSEGQLIKTISTNEEGYVEVILPYGKYKLVQINSTDGYQRIEPIEFEVDNDEVLTYELKDYKIPVPDTKKNKEFNIWFFLISWMILW